MIVNLGYPNRVYFELFAGKHPSDKIYSVQVADWQEFVGTDELVAAVVQTDLDQTLSNEVEHLRVEPTQDLIDFMAERGIDIPGEFYVQPLGFWFKEAEVDDPEVETKDGKSNNKAIWAAIVAALALLS